MVEALIEGVVNETPFPIAAPPVEALYQFIVPADGVAPKITIPVPQLLPGVVAEIVGKGVTVAIIGVLDEVVHPLLDASIKYVVAEDIEGVV